MSKVLTVFGATGSQGGSVVREVLNHPSLLKEYKIRAVTRDATKPAAKALESQGVEVVQADLDHKESVYKAVSGSYAVFGLTNFWEKVNLDNDIAQGKNIADASKEAGVQHLIWSSLPNVIAITSGKLKEANAFNGKAVVEEYIRDLGIPATFYMRGVDMSNLKLATRKIPGGYVIGWPVPPTTNIPLIDAASDTGKWVTAILSKPSETKGKSISAAAGWTTPLEIVSTISRVAGIKVSFQQITDEAFLSFQPAPLGDMRLASLIFLREWNYYGPNAYADLAESLKLLDGKPTAFEEFVEKSLPWVA